MVSPNLIVDVDEFTGVTSPATGEHGNQATFERGIQALANRTRYLFNRLGGGTVALAANTVLGRTSSGPTEGKPATSFAFGMFALESARAWLDKLQGTAADIDSAATTNIAGATGWYVNINGTTAITGFGTAPKGVARVIRFTGALTLTHNATLLALPGGQNIITEANDMALAISDGDGNWRVALYSRAVGDDIDTSDFVLVDGSRAFTAPVSGVAPTAGAHLATRDYVDSRIAGVDSFVDAVLDKDLSAPPGGAVDGDRYWTGAAPTDDWDGHANAIAELVSGSWTFTVVDPGTYFNVVDEGQLYWWDGAALAPFTTPIDHQSLIGAGVHTHAEIDAHLDSTSNPHDVNKVQVGLGNVTDDTQLKRAANDFAAFPAKASPVGADLVLIEDSAAGGAKKKSTLTQIFSLFQGIVDHNSILNRGTNPHTTIDAHLAVTAGNPHGTTKTDIGLANVTNDAQLKRAAADFATFPPKTIPVGADIIMIEDSAGAGAKKRMTVAQLFSNISLLGVTFTLQQVYDAAGTLLLNMSGENTLIVGADDDPASPTPLLRLGRAAVGIASVLSAPRALPGGSSAGETLLVAAGAGAAKSGATAGTAGGLFQANGGAGGTASGAGAGGAGGSAIYASGTGGNSASGTPGAGGTLVVDAGDGGAATSGSANGAKGGNLLLLAGAGGNSAGGAGGEGGDVSIQAGSPGTGSVAGSKGTITIGANGAPIYSGSSTSVGSSVWTHRGGHVIDSSQPTQALIKTSKKYSDYGGGNLYKLITELPSAGAIVVREYVGSGQAGQLLYCRTTNARWDPASLRWISDDATKYSTLHGQLGNSSIGGVFMSIMEPTSSPWVDTGWSTGPVAGFSAAQNGFNIRGDLNTTGFLSVGGYLAVTGDILLTGDFRYVEPHTRVVPMTGTPAGWLRNPTTGGLVATVANAVLEYRMPELTHGCVITNVRAKVDPVNADGMAVSLRRVIVGFGNTTFPTLQNMGTDNGSGNGVQTLTASMAEGVNLTTTDYFIRVQATVVGDVCYGINYTFQ